MKRKKRKKTLANPVAGAPAAVEVTAVEAAVAVEPPAEASAAAPAEVDLASYLPASVRGEPLTKGWL